MCSGIPKKVVLFLWDFIFAIPMHLSILIDNLIASAPNTGSIVLWDLNSKAAKNKIGKGFIPQHVQRLLVLL